MLVMQSILSRSVLSAVGPSVDTGSYYCGCGRILYQRGDLTCHQQFCDDLPPQPRQMEFHCGCGRIFNFVGKVTSLDISNIVEFAPIQFDPGPCYCLRTGSYKVCGCMGVCVYVCVCVCMCVCMCACQCTRMCACDHCQKPKCIRGV